MLMRFMKMYSLVINKSSARSICIVPCGNEVVGGFGWSQGVAEIADGFPQSVDSPLCGLSRKGLEFGESILDRIEVRAIGGKKAQLGTGSFEHGLYRQALVAGEVVHDHDVARLQIGDEDLADTGSEPVAVDGAVQHHGSHHGVASQTGNEGRRLAMAVRASHAQASASQRITDEIDIPKRRAAARQLIPSSTAESARGRKSIEGDFPIVAVPMSLMTAMNQFTDVSRIADRDSTRKGAAPTSLANYLVQRHHEIRPLQRRLMPLGLSSFGRG